MSKVLGPLIFLLVITVVLLIAWTIVDPWHWERYETSVVPPELFGECRSEMNWEFLGPPIGVLIAMECLALFFALKTADIPKDLRETNSILIAITTQIQAWLIGVPILAVLGSSHADVTYLGRVCLIGVFSMSSVAVVILRSSLESSVAAMASVAPHSI